MSSREAAAPPAQESGAKSTGLRVLTIWSRNVDTPRMAGRLRIIDSLRRYFRQAWRLTEIAQMPRISVKAPLTIMSAGLRFAGGLLSGRPLPLQCAIFPPLDQRTAEAAGRDFDVVYLDGVRLLNVARQLRRLHPGLRIVVDLDDLMSRRGELLMESGSPVSLGYLEPYVPGPLRKALTTGSLSRLALKYEAFALRRAEKSLLEVCDAAALLSAADAEALRQLAPAGCAGKVRNIPPAVSRPSAIHPFQRCDRFVFIGTDGLTQNRLTIDYLTALWGRVGPALPLVIFGEMKRTYPPTPGVSFAGYVNDLLDVYDGRSALVSPSFIGGGVKTKILESFAYGCPIVSTASTLEGMSLHGYPLTFEQIGALEAFVAQETGDNPVFVEAVARGLAYVSEHHSPERILDAWRALIEGDGEAPTLAHA